LGPGKLLCTTCRSTTRDRLPRDLDISEWSGAAELLLDPQLGSEESAAKAKDFFRRIVVPNKKTLIADKARKQAEFVEVGKVEGQRAVFVENGKIAVGKDGRPVMDITEAIKV
jgi:hypothetical protein